MNPVDRRRELSVPAGSRVEAVRFRVAAAPLPPVTASVAVGDRARWAVMASYSRLHGGARAPERLAGHDDRGPLRSSHAHAFYLPSDEDGDGRIDHLTVYCRDGFSDAEVAAIRAIRRLWPAKGGPKATDFEVDLLPVGEFTMETLRSLAPRQAAVEGTAPPWYGSSSTWVSATPFLLTRHPKTFRDGRPKVDADGRQIDGPEAQLLREWCFLFPDGPRVVAVRRLSGHQLPGGRRTIRWTEYHRWRETGKGPAVAQPYGFAIRLDGDVSGPVALGFASHYGLGLFVPASRVQDAPTVSVADRA